MWRPREMRFSPLFVRPSVLFRWWRIWRTVPVLSWIRAAELFREGNFRKASEYYLRGLTQFPNHKAAACARLDYAYCNFRLGEIDVALREVSEVTRVERPLRDALLLHVKVLCATSENKQALAVIRKAVNLYADEVVVLARYVHIALWLKDTDSHIAIVIERLKAARAAKSLEDPQQIIIDVAIAHYELVSGTNREEGEKLISRAFATGRAPVEAFIIKGEQLLEEGRVVVARELLSRACKMAPQDPRPYALQAKSYLGETDQSDAPWAVQIATQACRISGWQHIESVQVLADAYAENGEEEVAELFNERAKLLMSTKGINFAHIRAASVQIERLRNL